MQLINCVVSLTLTWSVNWVISNAAEEATFAVMDTKVYPRSATSTPK